MAMPAAANLLQRQNTAMLTSASIICYTGAAAATVLAEDWLVSPIALGPAFLTYAVIHVILDAAAFMIPDSFIQYNQLDEESQLIVLLALEISKVFISRAITIACGIPIGFESILYIEMARYMIFTAMGLTGILVYSVVEWWG